uniref:Uncharacterized protein n=1 Tax=Plectus sambesii TaxID=2011161 RepID=A0A914X1N6_9BILA
RVGAARFTRVASPFDACSTPGLTRTLPGNNRRKAAVTASHSPLAPLDESLSLPFSPVFPG